MYLCMHNRCTQCNTIQTYSVLLYPALPHPTLPPPPASPPLPESGAEALRRSENGPRSQGRAGSWRPPAPRPRLRWAMAPPEEMMSMKQPHTRVHLEGSVDDAYVLRGELL